MRANRINCSRGGVAVAVAVPVAAAGEAAEEVVAAGVVAATKIWPNNYYY